MAAINISSFSKNYMMYSIETRDLTHRFSKTDVVLNAINIQVPAGSIYGFLGPNGAGKTTTLKLMLGLLAKQQGSISVLGKQIDNDRINILRQVGSLIEAPSLYGHLTAMENLKVLQKIYQCPPARMQQVLETVGLADTGKKKAGRFSLGMKQRLSIAIALLPQPDLLILDEPTNGLDPNGIIEIRELLKRLNSEYKMTIVISSHLLSEIEKLVTHVGIINKGSMMFQGTLEELLRKQQLSSHCVLDTSDNAKALAVVKEMGVEAYSEQGRIIFPLMSKEITGNISCRLARQDIRLYELATVKNDLETIFIDLIKN